jgi:hypothetical protein
MQIADRSGARWPETWEPESESREPKAEGRAESFRDQFGSTVTFT